MGNNKSLELMHVADLLDMHFNIPNYQRGYRWESKHVEALLDDLYGFSVQMRGDSNKQGKFYCIQPLAVVANKALSSEDEIVYDVIDGQQRLTTLYLLLTYLQDARRVLYTGKTSTSIFTLKYESRDSDFFDNKEFMTSDIEKSMRNIDFFYMTRAYKAIDGWFNRKDISKSIILRVLIPENYNNTTGLTGENLQKAKEQNDRENDVRFIWYNVAVKDDTDSMEVFSQLNYGKTELTPTELVKALLFQCDIYTKDVQLMREITFRRSCEWDAMEKQLQNPFMWSMFMSPDDMTTSHMTIVLQIVVDELYDGLKKVEPNIKFDKSSEDYIYQVCNRYLGTNKDGDYAEKVKEVWEMVQTKYTALYNWYKNSDTYHLIGLLVWLKEFKNKNFGIKERRQLLKELMDKYSQVSKDAFIKHLKKSIAGIIHVEETKKIGKEIMPWGLERINYNEDALQMIRILVTFNVEDIRKHQDESSKFPFHLLRKYKITSLEHIHPQNLSMDNIKIETLKKWLETSERNLEVVGKYDIYHEKIAELRKYIKDEASYKKNIDVAQEIINEIDQEFNDLANMNEEQMHTLYNMSLVDKELNSALSNNLLDKKREILLSYQENKKKYVLPTTQKVFSKHYAPTSEPNVGPELWTDPDRKAYFSAIETMYKNFDKYYSKD